MGRLAASDRSRDVDQAALLRRAKQIFRSRRQRAQRFGKSMFGEPAWDMLLMLYIGERHESSHTVNHLAGFSDTPPNTAVRWLAFLVSEGLVHRDANPINPGQTHIELTAKAREALETYLADTLTEDWE